MTEMYMVILVNAGKPVAFMAATPEGTSIGRCEGVTDIDRAREGIAIKHFEGMKVPVPESVLMASDVIYDIPLEEFFATCRAVAVAVRELAEQKVAFTQPGGQA